MVCRISFVLVFISVIAGEVNSQDFIIRIYGDTIAAKVDEKDQRFVYYRTIHTRKGQTEIISLKEVAEIIYGGDMSNSRKPKEKQPSKLREVIQISAQGGYSWMLNEDDIYNTSALNTQLAELIEEVYRDLRSGPFLDIHANYLVNEDLGVGFLYSTSRYQNNTDLAIALVTVPDPLSPDSTVYSGPLDHDRQVNYFGLNLAFRNKSSDTNFNFQIDLGMGFLSLEDRGSFINEYRLSSTGIGGHISASFQLNLGEGFYLPISALLKGFNLSSYQITPSNKMPRDVELAIESIYNQLDGGITMTRFQLGLGLGFTF
ncbi:MAG: hypothetical protein MK086_04665 [Flavobacteriales bacterium]|nr:hypothetical protein [Flavobacteriales bacterium]